MDCTFREPPSNTSLTIVTHGTFVPRTLHLFFIFAFSLAGILDIICQTALLNFRLLL